MAIQNLEEINLLVETEPNYSLENKVTSIDVYFNDKEQVLIVGVVDNNYVYWVSLTDSSDRELNSCIFDYISKGKIRKAGHLSRAIQAAGLSWDEVRHWVKISLKRRTDDLNYWMTPFMGNYGSDQRQHNGNFFARDIACYVASVREKCKMREADGTYEKVLDSYRAVLNRDDGDSLFYIKVKGLEDILRAEEYLYGTENAEIRRKYIELRKSIEDLYNRYMTAVR